MLLRVLLYIILRFQHFKGEQHTNSLVSILQLLLYVREKEHKTATLAE